MYKTAYELGFISVFEKLSVDMSVAGPLAAQLGVSAAAIGAGIHQRNKMKDRYFSNSDEQGRFMGTPDELNAAALNSAEDSKYIIPALQGVVGSASGAVLGGAPGLLHDGPKFSLKGGLKGGLIGAGVGTGLGAGLGALTRMGLRNQTDQEKQTMFDLYQSSPLYR